MLQVNNLSFDAYGARLLNDICFTVDEGNIAVVLGPNGAGKSTLLRQIAGQNNHNSIYLGNQLLTSMSPNLRARQLAMLPQQSPLNFPFTAREVVELGRIPHSTSQKHNCDIVVAALAAVDISHLADRLYPQLSGGEKQRVQLARVLTQVWEEVSGSRLLLLDEPLTALDIGHQQQVVQLLRQFSKEKITIVMVLHDIQLAVEIADQLLVLRCGELYADGSPSVVVTPALLKDVYGIEGSLELHPSTGKPLLTLAELVS